MTSLFSSGDTLLPFPASTCQQETIKTTTTTTNKATRRRWAFPRQHHGRPAAHGPQTWASSSPRGQRDRGPALRPGPNPDQRRVSSAVAHRLTSAHPQRHGEGLRRRPRMRVPSVPNLSGGGGGGADDEDPEEPLGPTADWLAAAILLPEGFLPTLYYWILCCPPGSSMCISMARLASTAWKRECDRRPWS